MSPHPRLGLAHLQRPLQLLDLAAHGALHRLHLALSARSTALGLAQLALQGGGGGGRSAQLLGQVPPCKGRCAGMPPSRRP